MGKKAEIKTIWRYAKAHWLLLLICEVSMMGIYVVSALLPLNLSKLTDVLIYGMDMYLLKQCLIKYAYFFGASLIFNFIYANAWQRLNNTYIVEVKNSMFEKIMRAVPERLLRMSSGDVMSRIDTDADEFIHIVIRNLFHFTNSIILCCVVLYIVLRINPLIALLIFISAVVPISVTFIAGRITERNAAEKRREEGSFSGKIFDMLGGMCEIILNNSGSRTVKILFTPLKKIIKIDNRIKKIDFLMNKLSYLMCLSMSILTYYISANLILQGRMSPGKLLLIIEYTLLVNRKFDWIIKIFLDMKVRKVSIRRVNNILEYEPEETGTKEIGEIESIIFKRVRFSYGDGPEVLKDLSFEMRKGQTIGLVGPSGIGKTTVAGLILKFFKPEAGEILLNGIDINELDCRTLREQIGYVQQDILLFNDTIRYNLDTGSGKHSEAELLEACEKVGMAELIKSLPMGLDTKVGFDGYNLSGGEKQRLMIARILLKAPSVIIFDEATSALDSETEDMVIAQLAKNEKDKLVIIISHKLKSIKGCDRCIVVNDGYAEGIGTHEQLLMLNGFYRETFRGAL
ncbi:MAG: ABC transporter ATP-binding protein/permease [Clostridiales bacterium]|nr:ABC transporter ATP-binding protein/permease [Clostridiales bacterium]